MELLSSVRGLRNNNPLNIEKGADWRGLSDDQSGDDRFAVFVDPRFGVRAAAVIFKNYRRLYGIETLAGIVNRWAPTHENPTQSYVNAVSQRTGIPANVPISDSDYPAIIAAMIHQENGIQPYSMALIEQGVSWA